MDEQKIHVAELNETELTDITAGCTSILCVADHSDESDMEETSSSRNSHHPTINIQPDSYIL